MTTDSEVVQISAGTMVSLPAGAGGTAVNNEAILPLTNVSAFKKLCFALPNTLTGAGEVQVQQSNDPSFGVFNILLPRRIDQSFAAAIRSNPVGNYEVAVKAPYCRIGIAKAYTGALLPAAIFITGSTSPMILDDIPRELTLTGFTSVAAVNQDLLDNTGAGAPLFVGDYDSGELTIVSTASTGSYIVQAAFDEAFTIGVVTLALYESTLPQVINTAITPTVGTRKFQLNLHNIQYIRVNMTAGAAGVTPSLNLSQAPFTPNQLSVLAMITDGINRMAVKTANTAPVAGDPAAVVALSPNSVDQLAPPSSPFTDIASSTISVVSTVNSASISPTWGVSQVFTYTVTAVSGTPSLTVLIQESPDNTANNWTTIHSFTLTATGTFVSQLLPIQGRFYRYQETFAGAASTITRSVTRIQSNTQCPVAPRLGPVQTAVTGAANTSGALIPAKPGRKYLFIQAVGAAPVFISTQATATLTNGIRLAANGGSQEFNGVRCESAFAAISASAAQNIVYVEGF